MSGAGIPFFDLKAQHDAIRGALDRAVARVLDSGWYVLGAEGVAFEAEFAAHCGARHGIGVGSGTEALHLAMRACGVGPGDVVVTSPSTAVPTVAAIVQAGARPEFVDVDPETGTLSPDRLEALLRSRSADDRVKAVIPVHLYGHPAAMGPIVEVARRHGLAVIEDAAHAHGAEYRGRRAGVLGDAACFSFYPTKNLGACGDAGMVVTDIDEVDGRLRMLRNYGEEAKYRNRIEGINSRLDELQAAILRVKLPRLDAWVDARRAIARRYGELLADTPLALPVERPEARHGYHLYVVRCPDREGLRGHLDRLGIGTALHYPTPVHLQPAYRRLGLGPGAFPESERLAAEALSLPLYPELRPEAVSRVAGAIAGYFGG